MTDKQRQAIEWMDRHNELVKNGSDHPFAITEDAQKAIDALLDLARSADELQRLFDLQHTRSIEATAMWQKATGQKNVLPDLGELLEWLMEQARSAEARGIERCIDKVQRSVALARRQAQSCVKPGATEYDVALQTQYEAVADEGEAIIEDLRSLVPARECVWTKDNAGWHNGCPVRLNSMILNAVGICMHPEPPEYCPGCGHPIRVKED